MISVFAVEIRACALFDSTVETLGQRIRRLRTDRGWSIQKLAEMAGMSKDGLWQIEKDQIKNPYSLGSIASALGVSVLELRATTGKVMLELSSGSNGVKSPDTGSAAAPDAKSTDEDKALRLVEYAREHGYGPGIIDLANKLVKAAASSSPRSKAAQDRKKGGK